MTPIPPLPPPPPSIDPVSAIIAVLAAFLSPAVAHVMGAYAVIFIAAALGSGWALMRREKGSLAGAIGFIALLTFTTTLITVGAAEAANKWIKLDSINYLLAPIALIVAGIGQDWPSVGPYFVKKMVDFLTRSKSGEQQ